MLFGHPAASIRTSTAGLFRQKITKKLTCIYLLFSKNLRQLAIFFAQASLLRHRANHSGGQNSPIILMT
jgi:hypothetical protein